MKAINVNKMISAGCRVKICIADSLAVLNKKMGGDLKNIQVVGKYFIEIWKALGMNIDGGQVEFLWSSRTPRHREDMPLADDIPLAEDILRTKFSRIVR